eukprot:CAMPEP_0175958254 /NCGR_PEP_ID=MMETSP0108-20121206/34146_1 /TAXON_ID=195067 ORGANISM="Goniomonas pacifica, Strain CCMP1869" /NCGR_SAMPLE_ID=MMETSP0108 /ASSEMBLY_ACC=CAM_ASM_000204 /LENGTH=112 /DNA_ID=CAMNT_0017285589 /DNA_START=237 /DNA_END=571 /DNA_ORIENTATION=+
MAAGVDQILVNTSGPWVGDGDLENEAGLCDDTDAGDALRCERAERSTALVGCGCTGGEGAALTARDPGASVEEGHIALLGNALEFGWSALVASLCSGTLDWLRLSSLSFSWL